MAEKEVLGLKEIEKKLFKLEKTDEKILFLKSLVDNKEYADIKKDIVKLYCPLILEKTLAEYELTYDSLSDGLEPIYFWILDFMRDSPPGGLGLKVSKGAEEFEASTGSAYFGEIGQRATLMQKQAAEYLGAINQVIKSIINLIYDLKEFEMRIKSYDDLKDPSEEIKKAASYSLKGIWMDQVDIKKGKGSINMLAQDLNFVTIRDAFFYLDETTLYGIEEDKEIEKQLAKKIDEFDLNDRVKNILKRKVHEYLAWKKLSEREIKNRYNIEKAYLRSQVGTLKLYASWVKPYLLAAQKLKMHEFKKADIVQAFSNMEMRLNLIGKQELTPEKVHPSFVKYKINKKYYIVISVDMDFRSVPSALESRGSRHYLHGGRTDMKFKAYVFDEDDIKALDALELYEDMDLIEQYVDVSLKTIQDEVDYFLETGKAKETKKESAKKPQKFFEGFENPFKGVFSGFSDVISPLKDVFKTTPSGDVIASQVKEAAEKEAKAHCYVIYNIYKKTHGMLST